MSQAAAASEVQFPTFSLIIETENLASADISELDRCLDSLQCQDLPIETASEVVLINSGDVPESMVEQVRVKYPWADIRQIDVDDYYDAKMQGIQWTSGSIVLFADSDCGYESSWLRNMLMPFVENREISVVAGETTTPITGPYSVAMAMAFIFPRYTNRDGIYTGKGYYCNNVAFRCELLRQHPIPSGLPVYRGNCHVHACQLLRSGYAIYRQPQARALHALPVGLNFFVWRSLLMGQEAFGNVRLATQLDQDTAGYVGTKAFARVLAWKYRTIAQKAWSVFREDPRLLVQLPLAAPIVLASAGLFTVGVAMSWINHEFILNRFERWERAGGSLEA